MPVDSSGEVGDKKRSGDFREGCCGIRESEVEYYTLACVVHPASCHSPVEVSNKLIGRAYEIIRSIHLL